MRLSQKNTFGTAMSLHQQTLQNLQNTSQWLQQREADFLKRYDLTLQQYSLLKILKESHPSAVSVKVLKKEMPDKMSDVSRIVERMRKKGLLTRVASETDRRAVEVALTGKGLGILYGISQSSEINILKEIPNLSEQELRTLNELLEKVKQ